MTEIDQYQSRIFAALDKISRLAENVKPTSPEAEIDHAELGRQDELIDELQTALSRERAAAAEVQAQLDRELAARAELKQQIAEDRAGQAENDQALAELRTELASATAQVKAAEGASAATIAAMHEQIDRQAGRIESLDNQFQRLKDANATLRESNASLREKNIEFLGDVTAINGSIAAELSAIKTLRAADVEEMDTILQELKPLVKGQNHA